MVKTLGLARVGGVLNFGDDDEVVGKGILFGIKKTDFDNVSFIEFVAFTKIVTSEFRTVEEDGEIFKFF